MTQLLQKKSILIYGASGFLKTTQIGFLAKWIYERTGKKTRLISGDGGGWGPIQPYVDLGIIEPWEVILAKEPTSLLRRLSQGWWPMKISADKMQLTRSEDNGLLEEVGAVAVEGLSSLGDIVMRALQTKGPKLGESPSYAYREGDEIFYGANPSYYGFVQGVLYEIVTNFNQLLGVEKVIWSAHEAKGEEEISRSITYGPALAGKKLIAKAPAWFGDCIHADTGIVVNPDGSKEEKILYYFQKHPDPITGVVWPAKPRVPAYRYSELLERFPGGFFVPTPTSGLDQYLTVQDELWKPDDTIKEWKERVDNKLKEKNNE